MSLVNAAECEGVSAATGICAGSIGKRESVACRSHIYRDDRPVGISSCHRAGNRHVGRCRHRRIRSTGAVGCYGYYDEKNTVLVADRLPRKTFFNSTRPLPIWKPSFARPETGIDRLSRRESARASSRAVVQITAQIACAAPLSLHRVLHVNGDCRQSAHIFGYLSG